jgi:copper chaperone NosL
MITLLFALACSPSIDEPAPIAYDHVACDHCGMMVSDARFAAQLTTREGERLEFDDPACVFQYIAQEGPLLAHAWFRDSSAPEDAWLDWQEVAFVAATGAPMNGGVAAVPVGTEGSFSFSEASTRVLGGAP